MAYQKDQILDHDYDGIQEFDNRLPNWWLWILYGSIVFALGYWLYYHTYSVGSLPEAKYETELARAAEEQLARMAGQETTDESLMLMLQVPAQLEGGTELWEKNCVECHLADGSGKIGPNLTDAYWIHGGSPLQIRNTIDKGVPAKGMVAWGEQLSPSKIDQLSVYVLSIQGKNLPGKAQEGDLYERNR